MSESMNPTPLAPQMLSTNQIGAFVNAYNRWAHRQVRRELVEKYGKKWAEEWRARA